MSEEEFDELLDLMSENNLTQHGADTLYGEIVSRGINARLEIERLNNIINELEKVIIEFKKQIEEERKNYLEIIGNFVNKVREIKEGE